MSSSGERLSYKKLYDMSENPPGNDEEKSTISNKPLASALPGGWNYGTLQSLPADSMDRVVSKRGFSNLSAVNIEQRPFLSDVFTTLLEVQWRWLMIAFIFSYLISWLLFALIWYLILYINGDLDPKSPVHQACVTNIDSFTSTFLFSVETMQTTGYGFYHITDLCPLAVITLCAESIWGIVLEGLLVGIVFVKMGRAKKRNATLMFSRNAVINQRDGHLCFMFRVADMRNKSHLLDVRIRAQYVGKRTTLEGEEIGISQQELTVHGDGEKKNKLLLFWPTTVIHRIDEDSPLYKLTPEDLNPSNSNSNSNFEIVVVLEGIVEATGAMTQARSSYMPSEILWNHRFKNITSSKRSRSGEKVLDYKNFHQTYPVPNIST